MLTALATVELQRTLPAKLLLDDCDELDALDALLETLLAALELVALELADVELLELELVTADAALELV